MIEAIGVILTAAGPFAGWVAAGLLGTGLLWFYATDRLVSRGRHEEQAGNYEKRLTQTEQHYEEMLGSERERTDSFRSDRDYWRDTALELMSIAATKARLSEGPAPEASS